MNDVWTKEEKIMRKTWFLDIDGCVFFHGGEDTTEIAINLMENKQKLLEGTREMVSKWREAGDKIVITTGRPESLKELTKQQLLAAGIVYDYILCGLNQERHLVNDINSQGQDTAYAHNLIRNAGLKSINV